VLYSLTSVGMVESVVKDLLDTMIKLTLDDGATRRFGDYFAVRLDMRGTFDGYPWRQGVNAGQDDSKRTTTSVRQQGKTARKDSKRTTTRIARESRSYLLVGKDVGYGLFR